MIEMTEIRIRPEIEKERPATEMVVAAAFREAEHSDGQEHLLVQRLRLSSRFDPQLSLVAVTETDAVVGHILLTHISIVDESAKEFSALALAPVSVLPEYQKKGVGAQLIQAAHQAARDAGYGSVILLGHPQYYPRFGYRPASVWKIKAPFDVPDEAFMVIELVPGALSGVSGTVKYPVEFGI